VQAAIITAAGGSPAAQTNLLFYVRDGHEWLAVKRRGYFTLPRDCWDSPVHRAAAIRENWAQMLLGLGKKGYAWLGQMPEIRGPLDAIEFAENGDADPGLMPDQLATLLDPQKRVAYERAEKARVAKRLGVDTPMVGVEIVAPFRKKMRPIVRAF
jgi:hypothetical protein